MRKMSTEMALQYIEGCGYGDAMRYAVIYGGNFPLGSASEGSIRFAAKSAAKRYIREHRLMELFKDVSYDAVEEAFVKGYVRGMDSYVQDYNEYYGKAA